MSRNIAEYSDKELRQFAKGIARNITIRSIPIEITRNTTLPEKTIIESVVYGALESARLNIENPISIGSILFTAECILDNLIPECNGYGTIYMDLDSLLNENLEKKIIEINEEVGRRLTYGMEVET